MLVLLVELRMV